MRGRVWIRVQPGCDFTEDKLRSLGLPGSPRIRGAMLTPTQCVAMNAPSAKNTSGNDAPKETDAEFSDNTESLARLERVLTSTFVIEFNKDVDPFAFCKAAARATGVVAEVYPVYTNKMQYTPNDALVGSQAYLGTMKAFEAWDVTRGDSSVVVVISDAGTRTTHEDLRTKLKHNTKEIPDNDQDDDNNGYVDDYAGYNFTAAEDGVANDQTFNPNEGHGTSVTGLVAAAQNNSVGISGVGAACAFVPVKISSINDPSSLDYGYESILYAAIRGAAVVNCSWGNDRQSFNPLEQAIINYATARGTCVVAAAGNHEGRPTDTFYPANYQNVLSVMETSATGVISETSSYGSHCSISAPGADAVTTSNLSDASYTSEPGTYFSGTSSAAPMASGALALVRAAHPALSARQAIEHLRITGTLYTGVNPTLTDFVCRTANINDAVRRKPFDLPSLRVQSRKMYNTQGTMIERASAGDTVRYTFGLKNYLGAASDLQCKLRIVDPLGTNSMYVTDSVVQVGSVAANATVDAGSFTAIIAQANTQRVFLRLEFSAKGASGDAYNDFQLIEFIPTQDYITLSDSVTTFSLGDYGWVGSNQLTLGQRKGIGFSYGAAGNLLYRGGFYCTDAKSIVRSGISTDGTTDHDFLVRSRTAPWPYVLTISDVESDDALRLGITMKQTWTITSGSLAQCDMLITNETPDALDDFAIGLFLDWDINSLGDSCRVRRFTEGEPTSGNGMAELLWRTERNPYVACLAHTEDPQGKGQAAGVNSDFTLSGFTNERRILALTSGDSLQAPGFDDMSMIVGMRFPGIAPKATRSVRFLFGAAPSADSLARLFRPGSTSSVRDESETSPMDVMCSPNPADQQLRLRLPNTMIRSVTVRDIRGRVISFSNSSKQWEQSAEQIEAGEDITVQTQMLDTGSYFVEVIDAAGMVHYGRFVIAR
ncbi:MAG: S8 family peptidase [Candidatus Kapaibacterium sp.]